MSHAYVLGPSGTGKTTLLTRMVVALADTDAGAIVLDPHGDLVRQVLATMPAEHCDRITLFDLADPTSLPGLNPLWLPAADPARHQVDKARRSAAVTALFTDLWGLHRATTPNLLHFLEAALAALIAAGGHTLADLPRFLTDPGYRTQVVAAADDAAVRERWVEFASLNHDDRSRTVRAILNKAVDFSRNPILATVFGDPGPGLRLDEVMDGGRILLVSLPRGLVPEGTVELIGSVLVSLAYQAALAREERPAAQRAPVVAIIDEFQEFALSTFGKLVTATRKYGLGLVVANQNLSRIQALSPDLLSTLLANVSTLVTFRTAPGDARVLAPYMAPFDAADLSALAGHDCYWRSTGLSGPQVTAAHSRPPLQALRDDAHVAALAVRRRLPGRPLRVAQAPIGPADDWPVAVDPAL
jgi:hypothetical protein